MPALNIKIMTRKWAAAQGGGPDMSGPYGRGKKQKRSRNYVYDL